MQRHAVCFNFYNIVVKIFMVLQHMSSHKMLGFHAVWKACWSWYYLLNSQNWTSLSELLAVMMIIKQETNNIKVRNYKLLFLARMN
jgi:hypothetical protein